jgi:hypothetical protein
MLIVRLRIPVLLSCSVFTRSLRTRLFIDTAAYDGGKCYSVSFSTTNYSAGNKMRFIYYYSY